ncbi:AI-2E family transporter [Oscillatoria salina]|uniref:AI-2E family transporter n=1 Tax=Oscillatoria salina TaxID=331517 RepID=UPI001CCE300F|nr:AI-2E family transporter [Oscillatoria salina]MBZ8182578.1 AI-2E family transporter [Oscillatoria salina IIICB1]
MTLGKWIGLVIFVVAIYILWQIRQVLLLLFAAVVIANALNILVKRFQRSGLQNRGYAVLLSVFLVVTVLVGFFWLIVPPFADQFQQLAELVPKGLAQINSWLYSLKNRLDPDLIDYLPDINQLFSQLQPFAERVLGGGISFFSSSLGVLLNLLLVIVLSLMLLADPEPYRRGFVRLFPSFYRRRVEEILLQCDKALQGWLLGILFNMAVIAVFSFVGLLILGIPLALSQAMLAGLLTFIPNIGPALSVIPPIAISLLEDPWKAIAVLILYVIIQQVEGTILTPLVMAQQVSLLPAVTLLAQVFFASFFGFLGLFLALPLTVVGQVWLKEVLFNDILDSWQAHDKNRTIKVIASLEQTDFTSGEETDIYDRDNEPSIAVSKTEQTSAASDSSTTENENDEQKPADNQHG